MVHRYNERRAEAAAVQLRFAKNFYQESLQEAFDAGFITEEVAMIGNLPASVLKRLVIKWGINDGTE